MEGGWLISRTFMMSRIKPCVTFGKTGYPFAFAMNADAGKNTCRTGSADHWLKTLITDGMGGVRSNAATGCKAFSRRAAASVRTECQPWVILADRPDRVPHLPGRHARLVAEEHARACQRRSADRRPGGRRDVQHDRIVDGYADGELHVRDGVEAGIDRACVRGDLRAVLRGWEDRGLDVEVGCVRELLQ